MQYSEVTGYAGASQNSGKINNWQYLLWFSTRNALGPYRQFNPIQIGVYILVEVSFYIILIATDFQTKSAFLSQVWVLFACKLCMNTQIKIKCKWIHAMILKSFKRSLTTVPMAKRSRCPTWKLRVAGSIPVGDIYSHFEFFASFPSLQLDEALVIKSSITIHL